MVKLISFLIIFLAATLVEAQVGSNSFAKIVRKIDSIGIVQYEKIDAGGSESENFKNFLEIKEKATLSQLLYLTENSSAVVTCYAGWALIDRGYDRIPGLFNKFLDKDRFVTTQNGCIGTFSMVSSEFYHWYWNKFSKDQVSDRILYTMDSIIIYSNKPGYRLIMRAFENRKYPEIFNKRIEYLAFEKSNKDAIDYLKRLKDDHYSVFIKKSLIKYLQVKKISEIGVNQSLEVVGDLLNYDDAEIRSIVIKKLRNDDSWKYNKNYFDAILLKYNIQSKDLK